MRVLMLLAMVILSTTLSAAQTDIPVERFRSVELHNGGTVTLRHGPVQRVTMISGDPLYSRVRVASGGRLVIDRSGRECPRGYRVEVEVVTPEVAEVSVSHGGTLRSEGAFPAQAAIEVHVEQGGRIDVRSIAADAVVASVYSGGGIFLTARQALNATVTSGGVITHWGDARVEKSVRDGGAVQRGRPADAAKPLAEMNIGLAVMPPVPPIPPVPPRND